MGFYRLHRDTTFSSASGTGKTITINKGGGGTFTVVLNIPASMILLQDLSTCFTECGIQHTIDLDNLSVTLSDGLKFYFGLNGSFYVGALMDGDYDTSSCLSGFDYNPRSGLNNLLKYDMYVYSTEDGGFSIEMSNQNFENVFHVLTLQKVYNPLDITDYLWFSAQIMTNCSNDVSSYYLNSKRFHKLSDLTDITVDPFYRTPATAVFIPSSNINKLNVMFPHDYSTSNNYTLRELVYYNTISIPNYFVVNQSLTKGLNFDDGQFKYHILNAIQTTFTDDIHIAVRYDTV